MFKIAQRSKFLLQNTKNLHPSSQVYFSERIRNFFEVAPIYPDYEDQDGALFRDESKQKFNSNLDQLEKIKKGHMKKMYGRARQYVKKQIEKEQKVKDIKQQNKEQKVTIHQRAKQVAESILVDQETKLLFGFGFDDYIQNLKEKKNKDEEGQYLQKLQQILHQLKIKNDTELVQLYQYVIAQETRDNYRSEARKMIVKRVLVEISQMKKDSNKNSQVLDKYLDYSKSSKEFVMDSLENLEKNEELINLNEEELDNMASNIALDKLQKKIQVNKEYEAPRTVFRNKVFSSDFSDDYDLLGMDKQKNENARKMGLKHTQGGAQSLQDWKTEQIYGEIKDNFKRNKDKYEEELIDNQQQEKNQEEFFMFLQQNSTDAEIEKYLRENRLLEEISEKPEFVDVLENIDYLIDSAPISLKSKINNKSDKFNGSYLANDLSESDLLWSNFGNNFIKIFPKGKLADQYEQSEQIQNQDFELIPEKDLETIYDFGASKDKEINVSKHTFSEKDLEENERIELEVYRRVKTDPFFTHYIQNDLRYFSERMMDGYSEATRQMSLYDKSGDILNYNENSTKGDKSLIELEADEPEVEMQKKKKIEHELKEKVFAGGKRKKAHCLAILTKGSGKVTINKKKYLDYFPHPVQRNICMKPIYIANIPCMYDVDIHVRGGGTFGQCEAISVAIARAVLKLFPHLRRQFVDLKLVQTDPRKKERKKMGQYKARKAWTYVRR